MNGGRTGVNREPASREATVGTSDVINAPTYQAQAIKLHLADILNLIPDKFGCVSNGEYVNYLRTPTVIEFSITVTKTEMHYNIVYADIEI